MYREVAGLIWENIFQFPQGQHESVVWGKYAPTEARVHAIGREREALVRHTRPDRRYVGFISSTAGSVRSFVTAAGHGFSVTHMPDEGAYHAGISYRPREGYTVGQLTRNEKNELKLGLRLLFGPLIRHSGA